MGETVSVSSCWIVGVKPTARCSKHLPAIVSVSSCWIVGVKRTTQLRCSTLMVPVSVSSCWIVGVKHHQQRPDTDRHPFQYPLAGSWG